MAHFLWVIGEAHWLSRVFICYVVKQLARAKARQCEITQSIISQKRRRWEKRGTGTHRELKLDRKKREQCTWELIFSNVPFTPGLLSHHYITWAVLQNCDLINPNNAVKYQCSPRWMCQADQPAIPPNITHLKDWYVKLWLPKPSLSHLFIEPRHSFIC